MTTEEKRRIIILSAAAIIVIVAVVIILLSVNAKKKALAEAESLKAKEAAEAVAETEPETKGNAETKPVVIEETLPAEPVFTYIDAHGNWHEADIDETAKPCQYAYGALTHDAEGNVFYAVEDTEADDYYDLERGIDVSSHQGNIDWYEVRSSRIDYAILRAAYRGYGEEGKLCVDEKFEQNYTEAYKVGVKLGMYVFSQAVNEEEAIEEANLALELLDNRPLDMFIAYDPEDLWETVTRIDDLSKEQLTKNTIAFCETIKAAGYKPVIYSNMVSEADKFDMKELGDRYEFWYADYEEIPQSPYAFSSWQYSESGSVKGIEGPVDLNVTMVRPREESETEKAIYSYSQIPREVYENSLWINKRGCNENWMGDWAHIQVEGREFVSFGCGICCLSNTISTLTGEAIPPDIMFEATKEHTSYAPSGGQGAVSWDQMRAMCNHYGLNAELKGKPSEYEAFKADVAGSDTTVVVICQDNDKRLWWYTRGHYINIWDYDDESGTVFVTDPSNLYNRQRVNLIDVYHALKTANPAQYMSVLR